MSNITEFSLLDNASGYGTKKNPYSVSPLWVYGDQIITIKTNGTGFLGVNFTDMKQRVYADQTPYHVITIHVNGVLVKADISRLTETKDYGAYIPVSGDSEVRIIFSGSDNALTYSGNFTVYLDGSVGSDSVSPTTTTAEPEDEDEGILIGVVEALQHCKLYETRISGDDASFFALRDGREIYFLGDTSEPAVYKYVIENVNESGEVDVINQTFEIIECVDNPCYDPGTVTIDDKLPTPEIIAIRHVGECGWMVTMKVKGDTGYTFEDFPSFGIEVWDAQRSTRYFLNGIVEMPDEGTHALQNGGIGRSGEWLTVIVPINTYWVNNSIRTRFNHESGPVSNWSKWSDVSVYISQASVINTEVTYTCEDANNGLFDIYANLNLRPPYVNIYINLEESGDQSVERLTTGITSYFGDFTGGSTLIPIRSEAVEGCVEISDTIGHSWGCYTNPEEAYSVSLCPEEPIVECCVGSNGGCANPPPTTTTLAPTSGPPTIDPGPEGDDDDDDSCNPPTVPTTTTTTTTTTCDPNWAECEEPPVECDDLDGIWTCTCADGTRYLATPVINASGCITGYTCDNPPPGCDPVRPEPRPPTQPPPPPAPPVFPPSGPGVTPDDPNGPTNPPPGNPGGDGDQPCIGCEPDPDNPDGPPTGPGGPGGDGGGDDGGPGPGQPPVLPPEQPDTPCPNEEVYQLTLEADILTENWDGSVTIRVEMRDTDECANYAQAIGVGRGQPIKEINIDSPTSTTLINIGLGCPECIDICILHPDGQDPVSVRYKLRGTKVYPLEEGEEAEERVLSQGTQNSSWTCQTCEEGDMTTSLNQLVDSYSVNEGGINYTFSWSYADSYIEPNNERLALLQTLPIGARGVIFRQTAVGDGATIGQSVRQKLCVIICYGGRLFDITDSVIGCEVMDWATWGYNPGGICGNQNIEFDNHWEMGYYSYTHSNAGTNDFPSKEGPAFKNDATPPFSDWGVGNICKTCCEDNYTNLTAQPGYKGVSTNSYNFNNISCTGGTIEDPQWYGGAYNIPNDGGYNPAVGDGCKTPLAWRATLQDSTNGGRTWVREQLMRPFGEVSAPDCVFGGENTRLYVQSETIAGYGTSTGIGNICCKNQSCTNATDYDPAGDMKYQAGTPGFTSVSIQVNYSPQNCFGGGSYCVEEASYADQGWTRSSNDLTSNSNSGGWTNSGNDGGAACGSSATTYDGTAWSTQNWAWSVEVFPVDQLGSEESPLP